MVKLQTHNHTTALYYPPTTTPISWPDWPDAHRHNYLKILPTFRQVHLPARVDAHRRHNYLKTLPTFRQIHLLARLTRRTSILLSFTSILSTYHHVHLLARRTRTKRPYTVQLPSVSISSACCWPAPTVSVDLLQHVVEVFLSVDVGQTHIHTTTLYWPPTVNVDLLQHSVDLYLPWCWPIPTVYVDFLQHGVDLYLPSVSISFSIAFRSFPQWRYWPEAHPHNYLTLSAYHHVHLLAKLAILTSTQLLYAVRLPSMSISFSIALRSFSQWSYWPHSHPHNYFMLSAYRQCRSPSAWCWARRRRGTGPGSSWRYPARPWRWSRRHPCQRGGRLHAALDKQPQQNSHVHDNNSMSRVWVRDTQTVGQAPSPLFHPFFVSHLSKLRSCVKVDVDILASRP